MPKCSRAGCVKEAIRHSLVDLGCIVADVWACDEHYAEVMKSLEET